MEELTLVTETGREIGSAPSRRLRAEGKLPGVVYGLDKEAVAVTVVRSDLRRALTTDAGLNAVLSLQIDGGSETALVKDIQRHPVRREPIHVDFIRVDPNVVVHVEVPIVLLGEPTQVTQQLGVAEQHLQTLNVMAKPNNIPNQLEIDVSEMTLDTVYTVGDLVLPAGSSTDVDPSEPVVTASLTRAAMTTQEEDDAAEAGGEGAAGDAAGSDDSDSGQ